MNRPVVFFYVQHLWGVGHVYRANRVAKGLAESGFEVHLVWGGTRIEGFDFSGITFHPLTPVRTQNESFSELVHADGTPFSDEDKAARCDELLSLFETVKPDIVITEAFPFGRRQMLFELLPLLQTAKNALKVPMICASIRDIMQEDRKEKRVNESNAFIEQYFDCILVHGDENLIRIEETLQGVEKFAEKVRYTGLVTPPAVETGERPHSEFDVLISVGGGAFGQELTRSALQAMAYSRKFPNNWIIVAGSQMPETDYQYLQANCPEGMTILRHVPTLLPMMQDCKVSVSHAGYNTVADILRAGCKSVLYPYTGGRETEQLRRAEIIANKGIASYLAPGELTPKALGNAIDRASELLPANIDWKLDGADRTASILACEYRSFQL